MAVSCQQRLFLHERLYEWAFVPFGVPTEHARRKGFLGRSLKNPHERAYYFTHATKGTRVAQLVRVAGSRWAICFEQAKQETGLV